MMLKREDVQFWWKLSTFLIYYYHFKWRGKKQKALLLLFFHFFFLLFPLIYIFSVFVQPVGNIDQELLLFVILFVIMSPAFLRWNLKLQTLIEISRDTIKAKCCKLMMRLIRFNLKICINLSRLQILPHLSTIVLSMLFSKDKVWKVLCKSFRDIPFRFSPFLKILSTRSFVFSIIREKFLLY